MPTLRISGKLDRLPHVSSAQWLLTVSRNPISNRKLYTGTLCVLGMKPTFYLLFEHLSFSPSEALT